MSHVNHSLAGALAARAVVLALAHAVLRAPCAAAQEHDDRHHHHAALGHGRGLHFSHPLVTESPSPDTKIRFDYFFRDLDADGVEAREHSVRLEGEYAFLTGLSVEVNAPIVWRDADGAPGERSLGNTEIAVKLASFALADRGLLLGGGVEFGLPTGSDQKGIGSSHLVEVEPYVDVGYLHRRLELVAFASLGVTTNRRDGEEAEREFGFSASALYHLTQRVELLLEVDGERALAGEEEGEQTVSVAPGVKVRPLPTPNFLVGASVHLPMSDDRPFDREIIVSALYHF